ncbi:MAG: SRPBCC domain-containing protein [Aeromicrobium sp.]
MSAERSEAHHTFVIERTYDVPVASAWDAFANEESKRGWFGEGGDVYELTDFAHNFEVGGVDVNEGKFHGGVVSRYVARYTDIVEEQRIVSSYDMWVNGDHISTSVQTITFEPVGDSTNLTFTEYGVHLDGFDNGTQREEGYKGILDTLGNWLDKKETS